MKVDGQRQSKQSINDAVFTVGWDLGAYFPLSFTHTRTSCFSCRLKHNSLPSGSSAPRFVGLAGVVTSQQRCGESRRRRDTGEAPTILCASGSTLRKSGEGKTTPGRQVGEGKEAAFNFSSRRAVLSFATQRRHGTDTDGGRPPRFTHTMAP